MIIPTNTEIQYNSFDKHTSVVRSDGWFWNGPCLMMRSLVLEHGRATPSETVRNNDLDIVQYFIVEQIDDLFRYTLEFLAEDVSCSQTDNE